MTDNFLEKELARACLKLDSLTQSGTAAKLIAAKTQERIDSYAKMEGSKAKKVAARIATEGLDPQWSLRAVQEQIGELLAGRVLGTTPAPQQPAPAPARYTAPPPPAPKKTPDQLQAERDAEVLAHYAGLSDHAAKLAFYRKNQTEFDAAHARVVKAASDAANKARMTEFRTKQAQAMQAHDVALAAQFNSLTHPIAKYRFAQEHPDIMGKLERNEIG